MDKEAQRRIAREQRAGFELLDRLRVEENRRRSFADHVRAFRQIQEFARLTPKRDSDRKDDDEVTRRWVRIRERYESTRKRREA